jgi:methylglyoxal synthase
MTDRIIRMAGVKTIAIVAHDNKKQDLLAWAKYNREALNAHRVVATGTTGALLEAELHIPVSCVLSGPLGGDQQIGGKDQRERDRCDFLLGSAGASSERS